MRILFSSRSASLYRSFIVSLVVLLQSGLAGERYFSGTAAQGAERAKTILLLYQGPDGHPAATHEYHPGARIMEKLLSRHAGLKVRAVKADEPWTEGPELLSQADGVVLFLSEGGKWLHADPRRREALARLASRKGGIVGLHWGIGMRDAAHIPGYLQLLGGCHGGPDRKYRVLTADLRPSEKNSPIARGLKPFTIRDELYYRLKFVQPATGLTPVLEARIDDAWETVSWSWERPDGGRSFGFSGLHFHENWKNLSFRRLVTQGILWSMYEPIPEQGLDEKILEISADDLRLK